MKINVMQVKKGDYIPDIGIVKSLKTFSSQVAGGMSLVKETHSSAEKEARDCYSQCVDRVVVCGSSRDKSFYSDAEVDVVRNAA